MRSIFQDVPDALDEGTVPDDASVTPLPLSTSVITLFCTLDWPNPYHYALIFITPKAVWPMAALLRQVIMCTIPAFRTSFPNC